MGTNPADSSPPLSLGIIGAGHVGQTLGRLWQDSRIFTVKAVLNSTPESAEAAVDFIGSGDAIDSYQNFPPCDVYMITVRDDDIQSCAEQLAQTSAPPSDAVIFHCSGALSSDVLSALKDKGAQTASLHPVNSFASSPTDILSFTGTWCALEGDETAVNILSDAVTAIDGHAVRIPTDKKLIYHAGAVFACNYLTVLLDAAFTCYKAAGLDADQAMNMLTPLISTTLENITNAGPAPALTDPVARGDARLVDAQYRAIKNDMPKAAALYRHLAQTAAALAVDADKISAEKSNKIKTLLQKSSSDHY